jgi:predicted transposase/invertase (TIGR01784 family)
MDDYTILPARYNAVFTSMFTRPKNKERVLLAFLRHYIRRPDISSADINVSDPRLAPAVRGGQYPVVDVLIKLPDLILHLEIQLLTYGDTRDRILYYHSLIFGGQLKEGSKYKDIKKLITLCITDEELIPESPDYLHSFKMHDAKHGVTLSEMSRVDVLELSKIPDEYDDSPEWIWGSLFKADKEDEFDMLANRHPEVQGAVAAIKELSADPMVRHQALVEEMARRDWLSWTDYAETKGHTKGFETGHKQGLEQGVEQGLGQGLELAAINAINAGYDDVAVSIIGNLTAEQASALRQKVAPK